MSPLPSTCEVTSKRCLMLLIQVTGADLEEGFVCAHT